MRLTIGVDIGGTKVAAGVVDVDGRILEKVKHPTPADGEALADVVCDIVEELAARYPQGAIDGVGVGMAGFVDENRSTVMFAPNLDLCGEPLRDRIRRRIDLPVVVENDANAAAWGEARFGAGRGVDHVVCVTLGTGIGGGIIVNGQLMRGRYGVGAEIGHYRVVSDGRLCGCGNRGCWEKYASGRALVAEARSLARSAPRRAERLLKLADGDPDRLQGHHVTQAALEGDSVALECFAIIGDWVGQGLADLAAILDPERFVIGGGVCEAGEILLGPIRDSFARNLTGRQVRPHADIRVAELGSAAGIAGAGDLARI